MQTELIFSQGDSPANHTAKQEKNLEKKMTATSGRKCLEQYGKFSQNGLWAKTFSALLIGTGDWYSTRCKLTWKLKGTKYNRMYFQLVAKTHRTKETGSGLLPTPQARDEKNGSKLNDRRTKRKIEQGWSLGMNDLAIMGMLPTPAARDFKGANTLENTKKKIAEGKRAHMGQLPNYVRVTTGANSQLNPQFVAEMMGFPPDWTELPFLSGETKALKPTGTQ